MDSPFAPVKPVPEPDSSEATLRNKEEKVTADEALAKLIQEHEKQVAEWSRLDAEKLLAQLEDAFARLCDENDVAKAAIQLITERSSHIPPYTPVVVAGKEAKRFKELLAEMTPEERQQDDLFVKGLEENARRGYKEATVVVRELYGSLTQLLARITHEPDSSVGVSRILDSYHPNLRFRFYQDKANRKHGR